MTVASTENREVYNGNGVTVAFAFAHKFFANADLKVYVDDVLLTLTTDYTVSGAGDEAGGTVTFLVAPPAGTGNVVILRDPAATQERDFVENDPLPVEEVENALDLLTMLVQRLKELQNRSLTLADSDADASLQIPVLADRADKVLTFDPVGNVVALAPADLNIAMVSAYIATLLDDPDAQAARDTLGAGDFESDGSRPMTGSLTLAGDASSALHAVPKQQLEAAIAAIPVPSPSVRQIFTANGSWTAPAGVTTVYISGAGGGGGGNGAASRAGGGGGGGQSVYKQAVTVVPGTSYAVTIGAGGAAGSNGGATSLGALLTLSGGTAGGLDSGSNTAAVGGASGGGFSENGKSGVVIGGIGWLGGGGGGTVFGGGGSGGFNSAGSSAGVANTGGGGGGSGNQNGASGGSGILIVEYQ